MFTRESIKATNGRTAAELSFVPVAEVARLDHDGCHWQATGDNPRLEIRGLERWADQWIRFQARLEVQDAESTWPRLYFDCGSGYSEFRYFRLPECTRSVPEIDYILFVPATLREARLAPVARKAKFALGDVCVTPLSRYDAAIKMLASIAGHDGRIAAARYGLGALLSLVWNLGRRAQNNPLIDRYRGIRLRHSNAYSDWIDAFEPSAGHYKTLPGSRKAWALQPKISVLMAAGNASESLLRESIESILGQSYPDWELCIAEEASSAPHAGSVLRGYEQSDPRIRTGYRHTDGHVASAMDDALRAATGDYVATLYPGDRLHPLALHFVAESIAHRPDAGLIYTDEDKLDRQGRRCDPYFKCDFNYELLLAQNMIGHLAVYRRTLVEEAAGIGGVPGNARDYDLVMRTIEQLKPAEIVHVPKLLYHQRADASDIPATGEKISRSAAETRNAIEAHLERKGIRASVGPAPGAPGRNRVRFQLPEPLPKVSIIIPTRDRADLLAVCLNSIASRTRYANREVIVIDNGSRDPATLALLQRQGPDQVRVIRDDSPFNFSAMNNRAVRQAAGEYVCLLNNDIEITTHDWIEEMVSFASQPGVGAVGARLWYPDGRLQHGGVILGLRGPANHAHRFLRRNQPGYFDRAVLHQSFSAVTAACLMIRKSLYERMQGLDETLPVAFNDIDFCLRLREAGFRNVWTPYAEMIHHESASRGHDTTPEQQRRADAEIRFMEQRWAGLLLNDPAYSPNLSLEEQEDFLPAWPPRHYPLGLPRNR